MGHVSSIISYSNCLCSTSFTKGDLHIRIKPFSVMWLAALHILVTNYFRLLFYCYELLSQYLIIFLCSNAFHFRIELVLKLQVFPIPEKDAIYNWTRHFQFLKGAVTKKCAPHASKVERCCGYHLQLCTIMWWSIKIFHVILRKKSALPNLNTFALFCFYFVANFFSG